MAKLNNLKSSPEHRKLRNVIMSGTDTIKVYEPHKADVEQILDLQESWVGQDGSEVQIEGSEVVRLLFPMLTDIEGIDEMTDEEIEDVSNNPSLAFIQVQQEIEIIITEVYKTLLLHSRKQLLETDFSVEAYRVNKESFDRLEAMASKNSEGSEVQHKISEAADSFLAQMKSESEQTPEQITEELEKLKGENEKREAEMKSQGVKIPEGVSKSMGSSMAKKEYVNNKYGGMLDSFEQAMAEGKSKGLV